MVWGYLMRVGPRTATVPPPLPPGNPGEDNLEDLALLQGLHYCSLLGVPEIGLGQHLGKAMDIRLLPPLPFHGVNHSLCCPSCQFPLGQPLLSHLGRGKARVVLVELARYLVQLPLRDGAVKGKQLLLDTDLPEDEEHQGQELL